MQILKELNVGKITKHKLRHYGIQHIDEIQKLETQQLFDANMKLLKVVQLQNKVEKAIRTKTEGEKAGTPNDRQKANLIVTAPNEKVKKT